MRFSMPFINAERIVELLVHALHLLLPVVHGLAVGLGGREGYVYYVGNVVLADVGGVDGRKSHVHHVVVVLAVLLLAILLAEPFVVAFHPFGQRFLIV